MMRAALWCGIVLVALAALGAGVRGGPAPAAPAARQEAGARFAYVEVFVDSGDRPLAAYQIELRPAAGSAPVQVVGIEGGEHAEFRDAPYYDPAAMMNDHVIIAALSTAEAAALPTGRHRLARVHLRYTGGDRPALVAAVQAASGSGGEAVKVKVELIVEEPK